MSFRFLREAQRASKMIVSALAVASVVLLPSSALARVAPPKLAMVVEMKNKKTATIEIELYQKDAPKTVAHILDLVNKKFYDGILFHRFAEGFVVQAGDPKSRNMDLKNAKIETTPLGVMIEGLGEGGSGTTVPLEAKAKHDRGTLGMARSSAPDSGDSQFFFNLKANHSLDSGYCSFGKITKGLDIMDKLRAGDKIKTVRVITPKKKK